MPKLYDFDLQDIHGGALLLSNYVGQPVLLVNVASQCGLTPQYADLEALYRRYKDDGLVVVGIPCNQFGGQEPWPETQIARFCSSEYEVSFPMARKIEVNGEQRHPLYRWLAGEQAAFPGDISWNFEKFLCNRQGQVVQRFEPSLEPQARAVIQAIEAVI